MRLRYYERRVLKAIFKPFLAYLLCVLIVIAAVDRVPDPPFLKPHHDKAATLCFGGHYQPDSDRDPAFEQTLLHALPEVPVFGWSVPCGNTPQPRFALCLRQACDSSPPVRAV
jgi:hypothetical protein